jgi:hypothetical protein
MGSMVQASPAMREGAQFSFADKKNVASSAQFVKTFATFPKNADRMFNKIKGRLFGDSNALPRMYSKKTWRPALKIKLFAVALLASAFAFAPLAKADSITLENHVGNSYTYDLTFDTSNINLFILSGFQLSGLSGVTDAVLSGNLANHFGVFFDADSVTVGTLATIEAGFHIPFSVGTLTVTSLATPGLVDFAILDSNGLSTGQVLGPDPSSVPEPSSFLLLGSGLLAAAGVARRKLFA